MDEKKLARRAKREEVIARKKSIEKRQQKLVENWELRFFFENERPSNNTNTTATTTTGQADARTDTRVDVYIVTTDAVGLKFPNVNPLALIPGPIEMKVKLTSKKRGAEKWVRHHIPGAFIPGQLTKDQLFEAIEEQKFLEDPFISKNLLECMDQLDRIGLNFVYCRKDFSKHYDYANGISCESTKLTVSPFKAGEQKDYICYTYCLEHSAINKPKTLYKKSAMFGIDVDQQLGTAVRAYGYPHFIAQYYRGELSINH